MLIKKNILFLLLIFLLFGCTASLLSPNANDEKLAMGKWNDASLDQLKQGYHLYVNKCAGCHYLHDPKEYEPEKWAMEMPEMGKRAFLDASQQDLILRYILTKRENMLSGK